MKQNLIYTYLLLLSALPLSVFAGVTLPATHPRYLTDDSSRESLLRTVADEAWAREVYSQLKSRTDAYVDSCREHPDWLYSRLAMYWKSHATEIYVKGESFDHAGGEKAPVPTVRYTGSRGTAATHTRPALQNVIPYDDTENGYVTFINTIDGNRVMEAVHPAKTGRNIESLNREIMGIARDASFLYWMTGDDAYGKLAAGVFDTYMHGMYYRNVPIDLNHGHQQTLVGLSSFEVIHEDILNEIVPLYDFLYNYLKINYPDRMDVYAATFKKWADNIIANGVPHNNWNMMQARFVMNIAMILEDDEVYADKKGRDYYLDHVLNRSSIRQWSLKHLADYGFDKETGIWAECPGYSCGVVGDFASFTRLFDRNFRLDLTKELPVIPLAVASLPQYLFPNRMICGFGDTHPATLNLTPILQMIENGQCNNNRVREEYFTSLYKCLADRTGKNDGHPKALPVAVNSFFGEKTVTLRDDIQAGDIEDFVSPLFYSPKVSWLVQRNGMSRRHSLMASINGSEGNHMHANGISIELYGKGYVLGPDAGIGAQMYSGLDYAEYYSQFPSHNTVCVDGISSYPVMKSNHAFTLRSSFPSHSLANEHVGFTPVTYSDIYFYEPESGADQNRTTAIVTAPDKTGGYYIDVFRSRRQDGNDKMHDYFYHNLGQKLSVTAFDGSDLGLQPTEELSFAGAHLYAYSYIYDKKMAETDRNVKATFTMTMPDGDDISMNLWMKGEKNRKIFSALSPMTEGYSRIPDMPYVVKEQPTLTFIARQHGEARSKPFVSVYEPVSTNEPSCIAAVKYPEVKSNTAGATAISVDLTDEHHDLAISSDDVGDSCRVEDMVTKATFVFSRSSATGLTMLLMGGGRYVSGGGITIESDADAQVFLQKLDEGWAYQSSSPCRVSIQGRKYNLKASKHVRYVK